jgi:hypothetical protein
MLYGRCPLEKGFHGAHLYASAMGQRDGPQSTESAITNKTGSKTTFPLIALGLSRCDKGEAGTIFANPSQMTRNTMLPPTDIGVDVATCFSSSLVHEGKARTIMMMMFLVDMWPMAKPGVAS